MNKLTLLTIACFVSLFTNAQTKRVLFVGNSYTYVNDLPMMTAGFATANGDTLIYDSHTSGGATLEQHAGDATLINKIKTGNWDYVVLQEQSQLPSFELSQVQTQVFPYARYLDSIISLGKNGCTQTVFYMTWGRKNGDASNCAFWPPVCTYKGMDSLLNLRYRMMADSNDAMVVPVGAVWNEVRQNFLSIDLYQSDESHPSLYGTYVAACCFYTAFFRKNPELRAYVPTGIDATISRGLKNVVRRTILDSLGKWRIGISDPKANFSFNLNLPAKQVQFLNQSSNVLTHLWDFGDGATSNDASPTHTYAANGSYMVKLLSTGDCNLWDTLSKRVNIGVNTGLHTPDPSVVLSVYPNPSNGVFNVEWPQPTAAPFRLLNIQGAEQKSGVLITGKQVLDLSSLPSGVYLLEITTENKAVLFHKLIYVKP